MANGIDVGKAYVQIIPSAEGITGSISSLLNGEATSAGLSAGSKITGGISTALKTGLGATAAIAGTTIAGTLAVGKAMVSTAKDTAAYGDNVDKLSQKIGISAEAFQEWDYIFSQNGADISILETGMKKLSTELVKANEGTKSSVEKFDKLGLSISDLSKMSQEDIFGAVIAQLQEMPEGAERTALASDLLGKSAMELQPLLNSGAEATENLKNQAHELGLVMSDTSVKDAAAFTDSMDNLTRAFDGAKNKIGAEFMPSLTDITNGFASLIAGNDDAVDQISSGFASIADNIKEATPRIVDMFMGIITAIAPIAPDIIITLANGIIDTIPQLIPVAVEVITQFTTLLINNLPLIITTGIQLIIELVNGIASALPELIPAAVDAILTIVDALIDNIDLLIDASVKLIIGLAQGLIKALPKLIEKAPTIVSKLVTAIIEAAPQLLTAGWELIVSLGQGLMNMLPELLTIGENLVNGLIEGLGNGWNTLWTWLDNACDDLIGHIKRIFRIESPSKVFEQIGDYCVAGFNESFEDFGDAAITSVEDAVDELSQVSMPALGVDMSVNGSASDYRSMNGRGVIVEGITIPITQRDGQDAYELAHIVADVINQEIYQVGAAYA